MNESTRQVYVEKMSAQIKELAAQVQLAKVRANNNVAEFESLRREVEIAWQELGKMVASSNLH